MNKKTSLFYYSVPPIILIILAAFFYAFSVKYEFQFDDLANIVNNFQVRTGGLWELFLANTRWISQSLNTFYYQLGKFNPFVYRFANITSHILTGTVVYFVICLLLRRLKHETFLYQHRFTVAFLTAGFFLLHPVQSQTVSYVIQGQLEGLAALVTLSMIMFFLLYMTLTSTTGRVIALICMYICMLLAPGTKEIAIISPLLVLLVDWFFVAQGNIHALKRRWWLHASLFIGIFGMYIYFLKPEYFTNILGLKMELQNNMGNMLTDNRDERITPLWYCISQFKVILHYIWIFFWPFTISVDYDWVMVESFFSWDCIIPFLILVTFAAYVLSRLYKNKIDLISFGIIWFFLAVLPRSSIIPSTELIADYKTYLASFGLFFLAAYGCALLLARLEKHFKFSGYYVHLALMSCLLIPMGYALYERNKVWRTAQEFWLNILQNAPGKARAYNNYGVSLCAQQKNEEAVPYFKKAQELDKIYSDPHNNIAVAYGALGRTDDAIKALEASIKICPIQPEAYNNMASFYLEKNEFPRAEELLKIALRLRPHYGKAHFNLGRTYYATNKKEDAWRCFKTACLKADFDTIDSFLFYAGASLELKKLDDALFGYKKMLEFAPTRRDALSGIINVYVLKGEVEKTIPYFKQLIQAYPNEPEIQFKYAETLMMSKEYRQALALFNKVLEANRGFVPAYVKIAACLYKLGQKTDAFKVLEDFLKQNPPEEFAAPVKAILKEMRTGKFE
jgi:tetratricopeptide (TPR) repeat protein